MTRFQQFLIEYMMLPLLALIVAVWLLEEFIREHWVALAAGTLAVAIGTGVRKWML